MSEKRRDSKNRILQNGESQRKDGKYEFKYVDVNGVRRSAYSWKLVETDKVPKGKRCGLSLREMEKQIRRDLEDGVMAEIKKSHNWEKPKRHALTQQQQALFINFLAESEIYNHWLPLMTVFLGTGCRVGEVIGLTWDDCDFKEGIISINHNLIYRQQDDGKCEMHITTPKTEAGKRIVPMFEAVRKALLQEKKQQMKHGFNSTVIDGYSGFVRMKQI